MSQKDAVVIEVVAQKCESNDNRLCDHNTWYIYTGVGKMRNKDLE